MVDFLLAVRVSAWPRMYMPCLARDSITLMRFEVFKKPIAPCLQSYQLRGEMQPEKRPHAFVQIIQSPSCVCPSAIRNTLVIDQS